MKGKGWRFLIAALALAGALVLPGKASVALAGGPTPTIGCGHIGNDSFCVQSQATWDGSRTYYYSGPTPYLVGPGNYTSYDQTCGWYYSSNASSVDNIPNTIVFWCNYTVYPYNQTVYPRAWIYANGLGNGT